MTDESLRETDLYRMLIGNVLRFVSVRLRSRKEIREYIAKTLARKRISAPEVADAVLERAGELGYINDRAFAEWVARGRTGRKPKGRRLIEAELVHKGIDRAVIDDVLDSEMTGEKSERELARKAAQKKLPVWNAYSALERKRKLAEFLTRRGFSSDTVWGVVDELTENG